MKILIAHSNFKYRNRRNETIHFQVQANYEVTLEAEIELLCYKEFSGIALYNIENENIENPINFNARITNILSIYQSDFAWEDAMTDEGANASAELAVHCTAVTRSKSPLRGDGMYAI